MHPKYQLCTAGITQRVSFVFYLFLFTWNYFGLVFIFLFQFREKDSFFPNCRTKEPNVILPILSDQHMALGMMVCFMEQTLEERATLISQSMTWYTIVKYRMVCNRSSGKQHQVVSHLQVKRKKSCRKIQKILIFKNYLQRSIENWSSGNGLVVWSWEFGEREADQLSRNLCSFSAASIENWVILNFLGRG